MDTLLIQITNQKAFGLIHELEELHLIKVLKENVPSKQRLSEKYAGKLSPEVAAELQKHITEGRTAGQAETAINPFIVLRNRIKNKMTATQIDEQLETIKR